MKFNKLNQRYYLMNHITHPLYSCGHPINTHNIPVTNSWPPVRNSWPPSDSAILNEIFPFKSIGHVALSSITWPLVSFREKLLLMGTPQMIPYIIMMVLSIYQVQWSRKVIFESSLNDKFLYFFFLRQLDLSSK